MSESVVYLQKSESGELVEASLTVGVTDAHLQLWENSWKPEMMAYSTNLPQTDRPEDSHWKWRDKATVARGLHSLPKAEEFYEKKCGFTRLGPDSSHQNLTYYEMTATQADNFRRNH